MKKELLVAQFAAEQPAESTGRRKDLVFYSGAEIERYDFWNDEAYTIQFSMKGGDFDFAKLNNAPLLKDHQSFSVDAQVGHIENARMENSQAMATAVFAETPDVDDLWGKVDAGHVRNVSMGVQIKNLELVSKPKEKKRYMAMGWSPYEISVVPLGADPQASFVFSQQEWEGMPQEVREFLRGLYRDKEALTEILGQRDALCELLATKDLAKTGAASAADTALRERTGATLRLRQRQYGYSHR